MTSLKILIIGGYGTFGGRLAQLVADEPRLTLVIAGRSSAKAERFCKQLPAKATLIPLAFDRDNNLEAQLITLKPDIIVDATGPFQSYGADPYRVVKTALDLGIHYMDLADGSDFVMGISQFDALAKAGNIFIVSGVSSFPVLTAAVVRALSHGLRSVISIIGGIAPSPYAGVGLNVIRAVMGYAGKPVALTRDGKKSTAYALTETLRYTICPPGRLPLCNLRYSLVDVPDLQLLPDMCSGLDSIWMGVAPVPEILHRMLNGLAWLVKMGVISSLLSFAALFYNVINIVRWGEHRGGMFVSVKGTGSDGETVERSWHLLAEGNDGPMIPSMAIEGIIRQILDERMPVPGARAATNALELADYDELFTRRTIYTGLRNMTPLPSNAPLYQKLLDSAWQALPEPLRLMHNVTDSLTASGIASVERGKSLLARLVARITGFPQAGEKVPVTVSFQVVNDKEIWTRTFAGKSFSSIQSQGLGLSDKLLMERFGAFCFGLALVLKNEKLNLVVRRWSFLGMPLWPFLAPKGDSYEYVEDGRFHFHVEISHIFTGLIVRYQGWLLPDGSGGNRA